MKYLLILIIMTISVSLMTAEVVDQIIAKVGRDVILRSDLQMQILQMHQIGILTEDMTEIDILNDMIESRLILQTAKERDYRLDEHRIRQTVESQINNQIARFGSEAAMREELRKVGMSLSDLREYYDQMIREQRLKEMFIRNEIISRIHITDAEVEEYYHENLDELPLRPEMIEIGMIRKEIEASERTKRRVLGEINRIYDKLREGTDFGTLAREHSDCPSAQRNGDLGFFGRGTMIKEFEDVAFNLKPGEISRVVETQFGYHIIKMEERDDEDIRVRHILKIIEPTEDDISGLVSLMDNLLERLRDSENFSELAEAYSDDPSASRGGVIGEFQEEDYPEMFASHLERLDLGEFTNVIREENNLYIFGKLRRVPERPFMIEEIRDELKEFLYSQRQVDHYERWINNLRENSYVEILVDL